MADRFSIDGHKLMYHPARVSRFLNGETIFPIYLEVSPSGECNHRCRFCALDFMGYKKRRLNTLVLKQRIAEMAGLGVKSIMYAGEGEPFLHEDMVEIARFTKASGIDTAFTTNGVKIPKDDARVLLESSTFIKISINAGRPDTYRKVHGAPSGDFETVINTTSHLVETRRAHKLSCTVGWQMLLLPETRDEALLLAKTARDIGVDYLVIKPFSKHHKSKKDAYDNLVYTLEDRLEEELENVGTDSFHVVFRKRAIEKTITRKRNYAHCYGVNFWAYIDSGGNVWGCIPYIGDERMGYGNILEQSFEDIWKGDRRREALRFVGEELDVGECRVNCRMDKVNEYLWSLKHPSAHVNFI
jgi:cyclic pyranopterin phosphate synthase